MKILPIFVAIGFLFTATFCVAGELLKILTDTGKIVTVDEDEILNDLDSVLKTYLMSQNKLIEPVKELKFTDIPKEIFGSRFSDLKRQIIWDNQKTLLSLLEELGPMFRGTTGQQCKITFEGNEAGIRSIAQLYDGSFILGSPNDRHKIWSWNTLNKRYECSQTLTSQHSVTWT